jgi:hypothetical protein
MSQLRFLFIIAIIIIIIIININGVRLSSLGTAATTGPLYQPQMMDYGECEATGGTRRKYTPVPLCPPQIPHDLNIIFQHPVALR